MEYISYAATAAAAAAAASGVFQKTKAMMQEIFGKIKNCSSGEDGGGTGIDDLPDDLLMTIVRCMSVKESVRTSALARRWRNLWRYGNTSRSILKFDYADDSGSRRLMGIRRKEFVARVDANLKIHQAQAGPPFTKVLLINFNAHSYDQSMSPTLSKWVKFAASNKDLEILEFNLPPSTISRFTTLPSFARPAFHHLRTLRLSHVAIWDDEVHYFLSRCSQLEEFRIHSSHLLVDLCVTASPSLRLLEITGCIYLESLEIIHALNLVSLTFIGPRYSSFNLRQVPNLRQLTIAGPFSLSFVTQPSFHHHYSLHLEKLRLGFRFLNSYMRKIAASPDPPKLWSLKRLEVQVHTKPGLFRLLFFTSFIATASPQLQEFRIELSYSSLHPGSLVLHSDDLYYFIWIYWEGQFFPYIKVDVAMAMARAVDTKLKVVEVGGFIGCWGEKEFLLGLLENFRSIERVVIDTKSDYYNNRDHQPSCIPLLSMFREFWPYSGATTRHEARKRAINFTSTFAPNIQSIVT